jgi:hypothetical protein
MTVGEGPYCLDILKKPGGGGGFNYMMKIQRPLRGRPRKERGTTN